MHERRVKLFSITLRCTRPPQSQSGAIFCDLNHHCVVFKSARQVWGKITKRYQKYALDHAFETFQANKINNYIYFEINELFKNSWNS